MTVPDGYHVTLFAAEPDVRQPIAFTTDHRGRLWVAENYSYPGWLQPAKEKDRILILEDTDGDGRHDRRKVFWDQGETVSGLTIGFGGVWVCATPNLLFIPDRDGDDVPDGPAEVVLDGWDIEAHHNLFNALNWGPDGWLYGCNGIMSNSLVGPPGAPDAARVAINCGVWRYHPTRRVFEAFAHGTTNPWGLDFDDLGEMFITNCVIPHLFHVVPGARFTRMFGEDFNAHSYELLESCADHVHWDTVEAWSDIRALGVTPTTDRAGGGHAHTGAMIYLGDNWPESVRNSIFLCNIHGHRVNHDRLELKGSGYVARHQPDFLQANDVWFRGMELKYGPDGGVFLMDWSDIGECHETDGDLSHRENGRIYKITHGKTRPVRVDLSRLDDGALAELQTHRNDWYVRQARRLLQERAAEGKNMREAHNVLRGILAARKPVPTQLRVLWALHVTGGLDDRALMGLLRDPSDSVRRWAVRLLAEGVVSDKALDSFAQLARDDPSPRVRLALASALQRIPLDRRWNIAEPLVQHADDAQDAYLPLMVWYGVEPVVENDPDRAADLASKAGIPLVRKFLARRMIQVKGGGDALAKLLNSRPEPALSLGVLQGMNEALRGRKHAEAPARWGQLFDRLLTSSDRAVQQQATLLALIYGDPRAKGILLTSMKDRNAPLNERRDALLALTGKHAPGLAHELQKLIAEPSMRPSALRALAAYDDPETPRVLLGSYRTLSDVEKEDAVTTLASRPTYARALLDAVRAGVVPARDLSVSTARQITAFGDQTLTTRLQDVWGSVAPTSREKTALVARYKAALSPDRLRKADPGRGRSVFRKTCASCHRLFDDGGDVGPDLTGSDRANLDYLLENVLDPNASVGHDYKLQTIATNDGRVISGILRSRGERTLVVQTVNERLDLDLEEIEAIKPSESSMMPEGLFEKLSDSEIVDLVAYLASRSQVPERR
ncbi:MAG: hypothetical protein NVSMB9_13430 [Isosphaeraceae bacterium]